MQLPCFCALWVGPYSAWQQAWRCCNAAAAGHSRVGCHKQRRHLRLCLPHTNNLYRYVCIPVGIRTHVDVFVTSYNLRACGIHHSSSWHFRPATRIPSPATSATPHPIIGSYSRNRPSLLAAPPPPHHDPQSRVVGRHCIQGLSSLQKDSQHSPRYMCNLCAKIPSHTKAYYLPSVCSNRYAQPAGSRGLA